MVFFMCALIVMVGVLIGCGVVGYRPWQYNLIVALVCVGMAVSSFVWWIRHCHAVMLHVSALGQLRFQQCAPYTEVMSDMEQAVSVTMMASSTLWSNLLILHLREEGGRHRTVIVMRDSLSHEGFHALLVACRWLAMRQTSTDKNALRQN